MGDLIEDQVARLPLAEAGAAMAATGRGGAGHATVVVPLTAVPVVASKAWPQERARSWAPLLAVALGALAYAGSSLPRASGWW